MARRRPFGAAHHRQRPTATGLLEQVLASKTQGSKRSELGVFRAPSVQDAKRSGFYDSTSSILPLGRAITAPLSVMTTGRWMSFGWEAMAARIVASSAPSS